MDAAGSQALGLKVLGAAAGLAVAATRAAVGLRSGASAETVCPVVPSACRPQGSLHPASPGHLAATATSATAAVAASAATGLSVAAVGRVASGVAEAAGCCFGRLC